MGNGWSAWCRFDAFVHTTVRDVHTIEADLEEPFCYYVVALDSGQRKEPICLAFGKRSLCWRNPKRSLVTRVLFWDVEEGSA